MRIRRIVTAESADGVDVRTYATDVVADTRADKEKIESSIVWDWEPSPNLPFRPDDVQRLLKAADAGARPRHGGIRVVRMTLPPGWGRGGMHRTDTVDVVAVLEGQLVHEYPGGETTLSPGDILVKNGTFHHWSNRSDESCTAIYFQFGTRRERVPPLDEVAPRLTEVGEQWMADGDGWACLEATMEEAHERWIRHESPR